MSTTTNPFDADFVAESVADEMVIPMTFEDALEKFGENMMACYSDRTENEQEEAKPIIEAAKNAAISAFSSFHAELQKQLMDQEEEIGMLQQLLDQKEAESQGGPSLADVTVPTLEWILKNKSPKGKGQKLYGNHVHSMVYRKIFGTFPGEGIWTSLGAEGQKPWKAVAKEYTDYRTAQNAAASAPPGPVAFNPFAVAPAPVAVNPFATIPGMTPQVMQAMMFMAQAQAVQAPAPVPAIPAGLPVNSKGQLSAAKSASNLFAADYMKTNKAFPPKGAWAAVPPATRQAYEAKFKALQAARAQIQA